MIFTTHLLLSRLPLKQFKLITTINLGDVKNDISSHVPYMKDNYEATCNTCQITSVKISMYFLNH